MCVHKHPLFVAINSCRSPSTINICKTQTCQPDMNLSPQTTLLYLLEYPLPHLPTPYTHRYTRMIHSTSMKTSNKKHLVGLELPLDAIPYLHLIQTPVFTNLRLRRLWELRCCCSPRFCFGWLLIWGNRCGWRRGWGWVIMFQKRWILRIRPWWIWAYRYGCCSFPCLRLLTWNLML